MTRRERFVATIVVAGAALALSCSEDRTRSSSPTTVHAAGFAQPASGGGAWHGSVLRAKRWSQMLDATDHDACGRCHDGAPRPEGVTFAAPGAPSCTSCHTQPDGPLACATCHGAGSRIYPPRDPALFPDDRGGAHAAHVEPTALHAAGFACATCHPTPTAGPTQMTGLHGNGHVEVAFDTSRVAPEASYDAATGACAVSCHDRGGARARLAWSDQGPLRCGDCHGAPPAQHYAGACSTCHHEADATGTSLVAGAKLHANGTVDLGDGSGKCGACHGRGDDPWPSTAAHPAHESPASSAPVACATCHAVPSALHDPGHLDGVVGVALSGRALARNSLPTFDGRACANVACHGAGLPDGPATPVWTDTSGAARACGACHGIPPTQHTASVDCGRSDCHGSEIGKDALGMPFVTTSGKALHVDGVIQLRTP